MELNRREFVVIAAATCAGCGNSGGPSDAGPMITKLVDAGPAAQYAAEGIYDQFRNQGFFVVNEAGNIFALSSRCTHEDTRLKVVDHHSFHCSKHGSNFDENGKVLKGPATKDLPRFATSVDTQNHLIVQVKQVQSEDA